MDRTQTSRRMAPERLRSFQYRRQCARMVHGLVLRRLLRRLPGEESDRPGNRHAPRQPRRLLAAPNQSLTRCPAQQPATRICVYRLRLTGNSGGANLRGSRQVSMPGTDRVTCSRSNSNCMIATVIRPRGIVAERVLASEFFRDRIEDFLDLTAPPDQAFGQQECAAATVFRKSPQNTHVDFIAFSLDARFPGDQSGQRPTPSI